MSVSILAPSRLHFGLISPGPADRLFGGCGVMISAPQIEVQVARSESDWDFVGRHVNKSRQVAESWRKWRNRAGDDIVKARIDVKRAPPLHVGLGVGTQISLAIATGLFLLTEGEVPAPQHLATSVNRAARSAIGTYGFANGGFIVDRGKTDLSEPVAQLDFQTDLPEHWHWVVARPTDQKGIAGEREQRIFADARPTPTSLRTEMLNLLQIGLVPAAAQGDFHKFSEALYEYGYAAGLAFECEQGGPFNGQAVSRLVRYCRSEGIVGVGQSSWGPSVYSLHPNRNEARSFANRLQRDHVVSVTVAATQRGGAVVSDYRHSSHP